jgi:hypothetical protein
MVNRALSDQVDADVKVRQEKNKEFEENGARREATKDWPKILKMLSDVPYRFTALHTYGFGHNLAVHRVAKTLRNGNVMYQHVLCKKQYAAVDPKFEKCDICETTIDGRKNNATPVRALIGFVHNYDGATFKPEGSDNSYDINPVRVILVRYGKSSANIAALLEADRKNQFMLPGYVWEISKTGVKKETVYNAPKLVSKELLTDEGDFVVPQDILDLYRKGSEDFIAQRILNAMDDGVEWEIWGVERPDTGASTAPVSQDPVNVEAGKAKKALKG